MRKFIVILILLGLGWHFGYNFLFSEKFEQYADRTKEPWTCDFDNLLGYAHMVGSRYVEGYYRFSHTVARCPESAAAETAEFNMARCLEGMGNNRAAYEAYLAFGLKYPHSSRAKTADKASEVLHGS